MRGGISPINSAVASRDTLALAITAVAQSDGDYTTAIPALSLHRRNMPTAPMHCIYGLGLGVVAQGGKQVMLGGGVIDYGPGQSMLTTVDLPVVAHVTRASVREPFLGMMLALDVHTIMQLAAEIEPGPIRKSQGYRSLSIEALDASLLDNLVRLLTLTHDPALLPNLAPLIHQEITIRLLMGPHGPYLRRLVSIGSPKSANCEDSSLVEAALCRGGASGKVGCSRTHEPVHLSPAFPRHYWRESVATPVTVAPPGGTATDAQRGSRREQRQRTGRLRKCLTGQPGILPPVWRAATARHTNNAP